MNILSASDYEKAVHSQNACNLSGLVYSFARVMEKICYESHARNTGTDWKNKHPICALFAEQISHLSGCGTTSNPNYMAHSEFCEAMAEGNHDRAKEIFPEYAPLQKETVDG